jgi:hypothetical protein
MSEKFIADFKKPRLGSEFVYVGQAGLLYQAFLDLAVAALRRCELVNGVILGPLKIEKNTKTNVYTVTTKVVRLAGNA